MIARAGARCERELGRTTNESEPSARGEPPSLGRRQPGVSGMRPDVVVIEPPALEQLSGVGEVLEYLLVQELVAKPADEGPTKAICAASLADVVPVEAGRLDRHYIARGKPRTIADDRRRRTMPGNEPIEGATRFPEIAVSATAARHSRVQSSTTTRIRMRRAARQSETKSSDQH